MVSFPFFLKKKKPIRSYNIMQRTFEDGRFVSLIAPMKNAALAPTRNQRIYAGDFVWTRKSKQQIKLRDMSSKDFTVLKAFVHRHIEECLTERTKCLFTENEDGAQAQTDILDFLYDTRAAMDIEFERRVYLVLKEEKEASEQDIELEEDL